MLSRRRFAAAGLAAFLAVTASGAEAQESVTIFAAASLKTALDAVNEAWRAETGKTARASYAASSALARQIEQGAPADIFFPADLDWMDYLCERSLIDKASVARLLGNDIVLIAPRDSAAQATIAPGFPLAALLGDGRLAMADVKAVPAGKYGKAALESLGIWGSVEAKLAQAENVRAALKLVSTSEAPLGIVYRTDAEADPAVRILGSFPAESHPPVVYPVARTAASNNPDTDDFLAFLRSPKALAIFRAQGFRILE